MGDDIPTVDIVPPSKLPSAWREQMEQAEERSEATDGTDAAEWDMIADTLRGCADELEASLAAHDTPETGDAELGAAFRKLYEAWEADADSNGAYAGSAADQCSHVYEVFTAHGLVVR